MLSQLQKINVKLHNLFSVTQFQLEAFLLYTRNDDKWFEAKLGITRMLCPFWKFMNTAVNTVVIILYRYNIYIYIFKYNIF